MSLTIHLVAGETFKHKGGEAMRRRPRDNSYAGCGSVAAAADSIIGTWKLILACVSIWI